MVTSSTTNATRPRPSGILGRNYRLVTLGSFALMVVAAFESVAVTTIMPVISTELDGASLYSVAFAGPLAISVVGVVVAGNWSDRAGPARPLYVAVGLFAIGLIVAGSAGSMWMLVVGRLIHGLGGGAITVALYVVVARLYPAELQARIFGAFAAAWMLPAFVGPYLAGLVSDTVGWRWVFLGVIALVIPATAMVWRALRAGFAKDVTQLWHTRRIAWSALLAVAVLLLSISVEFDGMVAAAVAIPALLVSLAAVRPLLPARTLLAAPGLPSVMLLKFFLVAALFAVEVYLPYLFTSQYGLSPAIAGLALTASGVSWAGASWAQGMLGDRLTNRAAVVGGILGVLLGIIVVLLTALFALPAWFAIASWAVAGAGMGTVYPRLAVLVFAASSEQEQGFNSSALTIADGIGPAIAIAIAGIVFAGTGGASQPGAFAFVFVFGGALTLITLWLSRRALRIGATPSHAGQDSPGSA